MRCVQPLCLMDKFGLRDQIQQISKIHGKVFETERDSQKIRIIPFYHPAVAIYNLNMKEGLIESALIVCKKTLLRNWEEEINFHCHLSYQNITGSIKDRKKYITNFAHFYIVNYEALIQEEFILKELLKIKKKYLHLSTFLQILLV